MIKKMISVLIILVMAVSLTTVSIVTNGAETVDYGLADKCEDGNILQCFNWTLAQIKAELPNIASAGFTSVQTSPLQAHNGYNQWYWLYQPNGFTIGNELGSYDDLKGLCTEADKYGIKIIVDVVANHVAGSSNGTWASSIDSALKKSEYFHNQGAASGADYDDRYKVTHKNIGMPDLNSEHADIQNMVYNMIVKLKEAGVDGIRWDAAKHIGLPSENCAFWSKMAQVDIYQYGEILNAPAGDSPDTVNDPLMEEYTDYIAVNDDKYSSEMMRTVNSGTIYRQAGYWTKKGIPADRLVYWAESHDTFSNDGTMGWTKNFDQNTVDRAYAILGARANVPALYLSRPSSTSYSSIYYGRKGSTHFTSSEIAAVNHFHNAMIGTDEKFNSNAGCYVVWRGGGAVIVCQSGSDKDIAVTNYSSMVPVGTYTDEVSGSSFTVTSTKITGHVGSTGIAVIYNKPEDPTEPETEPPTDPPTEPPTEPPVPYILGDTDGSSEVEIIDATLVQRYLADIEVPFTERELLRGDVDRSGELESTDATAIQRFLVDMETPYPIGDSVT